MQHAGRVHAHQVVRLVAGQVGEGLVDEEEHPLVRLLVADEGDALPHGAGGGQQITVPLLGKLQPLDDRLDVGGHLIEGGGQLAHLVTGRQVDALVQVPFAQAPHPSRQLDQRIGRHAAEAVGDHSRCQTADGGQQNEKPGHLALHGTDARLAEPQVHLGGKPVQRPVSEIAHQPLFRAQQDARSGPFSEHRDHPQQIGGKPIGEGVDDGGIRPKGEGVDHITIVVDRAVQHLLNRGQIAFDEGVGQVLPQRQGQGFPGGDEFRPQVAHQYLIDGPDGDQARHDHDDHHRQRHPGGQPAWQPTIQNS